jgi:hypothetical protein
VGLDIRNVDPATGNYMFEEDGVGFNHSNVIIGKTMLMHRRFPDMARALDEEVKDSVGMYSC